MREKIAALVKQVRMNRFDRSLMRYFDWPLFLNVLLIALFGVVCIFSATTTSVTEKPATIMEMLETQPVEYARLQLVWLSVGILAMMVVIYFGYELYGHYANTFYVLNIVLLVVVLGMEAGRGGMTAFFTWGSGSERTFQPSEVGKIAMIIAFAKAFSVRLKPVMNVRDLLPLIVYMGIPLLLIIAQPDVGTALVYLAVFCVMVFVSGTNYKLILGVLACAVVLIIPVWTFMNATDSFRLMRILIWLDPESYPDEARQVINAGIAVGRGGLWGQGIVSPGSYASLGYISDDHTDFIFAVICEEFGVLVGIAVILFYVVLILRGARIALDAGQTFYKLVAIGCTAMVALQTFIIVGGVIKMIPLTGVTLPFISYGGSSLVTNMVLIGIDVYKRQTIPYLRMGTKAIAARSPAT